MKPNEQLSWALVAISLIALPKWVFAVSLFFQPDVLAGSSVQTQLMIVIAGVCSLLLFDLSQPLSALFALVAASTVGLFRRSRRIGVRAAAGCRGARD